MDPDHNWQADDYEQMADSAKAEAEGHAANLERESSAFLKSIHQRKIDQAQQSERHFRDQAQKARDRSE